MKLFYNSGFGLHQLALHAYNPLIPANSKGVTDHVVGFSISLFDVILTSGKNLKLQRLKDPSFCRHDIGFEGRNLGDKIMPAPSDNWLSGQCW